MPPADTSSSDFQNAVKTFLLLINHLNYFYIAKRLRFQNCDNYHRKKWFLRKNVVYISLQ